MSLQKAGSNLDNEIANVLNEATDDRVSAHSTRGSGNTGYPEVDVLVRTPFNDAAIESKRTSVGTGEHAYVLDTEDTRQLSAVANDYTTVWVLVQFTRREPLLFRCPKGELVVDRIPEAFDPHVTDSGSLRLTKPDTDEWPSKTKGDSLEDVLIERLSLEEYVNE